MRLRRKIREVTYNFEDLRDLLAKASPYRSGDALAGIAAESAEQRAAAQMTLADLPLRAFLQQALVPYESDEVTRLIIDTHDPAAFAPVAALTVGDLRDWLLSDAATGEALAALGPGLTPEMVAAVSKLMRVQDLILVARKIRVVTRFRTTVGLAGQALHPAAAEPSGGRSGRHRRGHGRWPPAGLRGCGDRDQSRFGQCEQRADAAGVDRPCAAEVCHPGAELRAGACLDPHGGARTGRPGRPGLSIDRRHGSRQPVVRSEPGAAG